MKKIFLILYLSMFYLSSFSQNCLNDSLNISTGYDPRTNQAANGLDPRWRIINANANAIGGSAFLGGLALPALAPVLQQINALHTPSGGNINYPANPVDPRHRYISWSNNPTQTYDLVGQIGNQIAGFQRIFRTCVNDTIRFTRNIAADNNFQNVLIDNIPIIGNNQILFLSAGSHTITFELVNTFAGWTGGTSWNPTSILIEGHLISTRGINSIVQEYCYCDNYICKDSCTDEFWGLRGNDVKTNYFIGSINNADFKIRTNNTEKAVITASGNVGIGSSTPTHKLHIEGNARVTILPTSQPKDALVFSSTGTTPGELRSLATTGNTNEYLAGDGTWQKIVVPTNNFWNLTGNTIVNTDFIGTINNDDFRIRTNNIPAASFTSQTPNRTNSNFLLNPSISWNGNIGSSNVIGVNTNLTNTNNNQRLRITSGNSDPMNGSQGASIDLHGNNTFQNQGKLDLVAGAVANTTKSAIRFWTNTTATTQSEKVTILGNGNVGVGTTTPTEKLHIMDGNILVDAINSTTTNPRFVGIQYTGAGAGQAATFNFGDRLNSFSSSFGGKMITQSFWGIKFVGNRQSATPFGFEAGNLVNQAALEVTSDVIGSHYTPGPIFQVTGAPNQSAFLQEWRNNAALSLGVVTANGRFGIGNDNPGNVLEIRGENPVTSNTNRDANTGISGQRFRNLRSGATAITNPGLGVLSVNANGDVIYVATPTASGLTNSCSTKNLNFVPKYDGANSLTCSQIFDNGTSVGIGATGPFTYSLTTFPPFSGGSVTTTGTLKLDVNGIVRCTGIFATSDEKLKTNIKSIENANSIISKLNGKTYFWSKEYLKDANLDNGRHYGFLAQDLEKIMPEAVIKDENGRYAVEYNAIIPVLVESQKELIKENEELKSKLAGYDEKFELLEKSIAALCENGCGGLKEIGAKTTSDVDALFQSIPNPTDDVALINYYLTKEYNDATISISTTEGKTIQTINLESKVGNGSVKISLGSLAQGTYLYTLTAGKRIVDTKKLQIMN